MTKEINKKIYRGKRERQAILVNVQCLEISSLKVPVSSVVAELGSAASGSVGERRARAGGPLAPVGHCIDR